MTSLLKPIKEVHLRAADLNVVSRGGVEGQTSPEEPNNFFARPASHHGNSLDRNKKIFLIAIKSEAPILNGLLWGLIEGEGGGVDNSVKSIGHELFVRIHYPTQIGM
ncbi:hypothetical protein CDAR_544821 [Caerostris darwini]|uniref:Uncharacterized protein n=1 Tax=Caerostris darwini TaxID=1538125 RepID=A0AAV4V747_9ARAC|nr:hypothetical protein CDAR_544821 [Caerostris darwini]